MQFGRSALAPPEGDAPTRARVARRILERGPSTAADLARDLDLTPAGVRRHLDHLVEEGVVEAGEQRVTGARGRGRPAKVFRLTETGRDHFEQQYDDLAAQALRFLRETQGDEAVLEFARRRVAFIGRDYAKVRAARPDATPVQALAQVFTDEGYAATSHEMPIGEQLCQQHCPVAHVAHEFPELCDAETEAISKVLDTHVQRLATIAHGDGVCTTCIPHTSQQHDSQKSGNPEKKDGASA